MESSQHQEIKDLKDPSLLLSPPSLFKCSESTKTSYYCEDDNNDDYDEDDDEMLGRIEFTCTIPLVIDDPTSKNDCRASNIHNITTLKFRCRDQSVGFLHQEEISTKQSHHNVDDHNDDDGNDDDEEGMVDPNFFDTGYTLAGRTGFQIWAGSRVMMEILLQWPSSSLSSTSSCQLVPCQETNDIIKQYQNEIINGANIIELGSGVGIVGTSLASVGGYVIMTDLETLVNHSLWPNITLNQTARDNQNSNTISNQSSIQIHNGWAEATVLDWTKPVQDQLSIEQISNTQLIVSCDCVWLVSMLDGLLDSVASIFTMASSNNDVAFLMSFQRRDAQDGNESSTFTTVDKVLRSVEERGWRLKCLAWRPVVVKGEGDYNEVKEVYVFEIKP